MLNTVSAGIKPGSDSVVACHAAIGIYRKLLHTDFVQAYELLLDVYIVLHGIS